MNPASQIDHSVLLATVRVMAAMELFPRLVGPKDNCAEWMRVNLDRELSMLSQPTTSSPHTRILGSLGRVLEHHYLSGMTTASLHLDQVRADDPLVCGREYVDIPSHVLPKLQGSDFWWKALPPSVQLRVPSPLSTAGPLNEAGGSSHEPGQAPQKLKRVKLKLSEDPRSATSAPPPPPAVSATEGTNVIKSKANDNPSDGETVRSRKRGRVEAVLNSNKRVTEEGGGAPPKKKTKSQSMDSDGDANEAGPSNVAAMADLQAQLEPSGGPIHSKDCEACKSRGNECVWPGGSASQDEKRACVSCVSQKRRCYINGVFSIRRPRGRAATSQTHLSQQQQLIRELNERTMVMEKKLSASEADNLQLLSTISNMEFQIKLLKEELSTR